MAAKLAHRRYAEKMKELEAELIRRKELEKEKEMRRKREIARERERQRENDPDRESDWKYNTFNRKNMRPIGDGLQDWTNDYVILNTDRWAPAFNHRPVCKTEKSCPVCPNMTSGYAKQYTTLKDFNSSRRIMAPDSINLDYIDKLNRGE